MLTVVVLMVPDSEIDLDFRVVDPPTTRSVFLEISVELKDCRRGVGMGDAVALEFGGLGLVGEWIRNPAIWVS